MPVMNLTKTAIDKIPFTDSGQVLYHDQNLKGFLLRVGRNSKAFCVYSTVNRKSRQITIGRYGVYTVEQARKKARDLLYNMSNGIDPVAEQEDQKRKNMTLGELVDEFMHVRKTLTPHTRRQYRSSLRTHVPDWLNKPVTEITEHKFLERYFYVGENSGTAPANSLRRVLSSMINYGMAAHGFFENNPIDIVKKTRSGYPVKRRRTILKPAQLAKWWDGVNKLESDLQRDYLKLVLLTGLRRNEAASIKFSDIDFDDKTVHIPQTKNGEPLTLPLSDYLYELLFRRYQDKGESDFVFPGYGENNEGHLVEPKKAVYRVRKNTGIFFTIHCLRRSYLSVAASLDIGYFAMKRLVGHTITNEVTGGYVVLGAEDLRPAMQKITDFILGHVNDRD